MFKSFKAPESKQLNHSGRSLVGETLQIEGDIRSSGSVDVAGLINGDVFVSDMIVIGKFCFIGTEQGLFRVNMKSHRVREYDFDFIGSINALERIDKYLWIGSSEGLIRFKWRKDL